MAYFQGRTVSFREGTPSKRKRLVGDLELRHPGVSSFFFLAGLTVDGTLQILFAFFFMIQLWTKYVCLRFPSTM